uniref:Uncharacterized protein n=1 Tax=Arundo donax TaxID=35708 RepID=A0A0A9GWZ8_ARUDO
MGSISLVVLQRRLVGSANSLIP